MADMLVNLNNIPDYRQSLEKLKKQGITIIRPIPPDKFYVVEWVKQHSSIFAAGECDRCFSNASVSCFIAVLNKNIVGYACYDATAPDFFGPMKVLESEQKKGIGKALLLRALSSMRESGYQYAIIGSVGPISFYEKNVGAVVIESSKEYSVYDYMLKQKMKDDDWR